jgi:hypothetical protein
LQRHRLRLLGLLALLILSSPARESAQAQFSAPYDPDFAPAGKPAASSKTEASLPDQAPEELPAVVPAAGPFLLLERPDAARIFEQEPPSAAQEKPDAQWSEIEKKLAPFEYTQDKHNKVRRDIEEGREPSERRPQEEAPPLPEGVAVSTETAPRPPPPEIELPTYGTSLSVTGRKIIGFQFSEKRFTSDQKKTGRPATTNLVEINQQLQLRMQGKVGPKITINVDYDDTKVNQQDISVVYTGDSDEVVQNVSFGDIDLSLPSTEFVSYNKQLFGIRADIKYRGLKATFIGSRTKGTTKTKQFFGNSQFVALDLQDTGYVRRQHYDLTFGNSARLPLKGGTERIYLARQIPGQTNVNEVTLTADDLTVQTSSFTGSFLQLQAGQDYTIDYVRGILSFRSQLQPQYIVAVDFIDNTKNSITVQTSSANASDVGGSGRLKLVKTSGDVPIVSSTTESGYNRELKTIYNIGQTQIVRDNGRGNFILQVLNQQRQEVGGSLNPQQKYPETIIVDFENGTFRLEAPFSIANASPTVVDPEIYAPTPIPKRIIHVEYNYRFKTFFLEPTLVVQSEIVLLDGIKLNRNVDYFIDYEAGFITFFNEQRIRPQSEIAITYEVAPFIGATNDSLLGTRVSYDFTNKFSLGSTLLYQAGAKSQTVPTVTELARSLLVYEFDSQLKSVRLFGKLTGSFAAELAQSRQNLNLNDLALVDNMEGIKQEDSASTLAQAWQIAANPGGVSAHPLALNWFSEDVKVLEINPRAQAGSQESQKVLDLAYDFSQAGPDEASIVFPFSVSGIDFSQKNVLEVVMLGDNSNNELNFHLGGINEDSDNDGVFDTEDVNVDNLLQPSEDIGFLYNPAAGGSARYVAGNGIIDTEDVNRNGRLDPADFNGGDFGYIPDPNNPGNAQLFSITDSANHSRIDFGGGANWHTLQIPLNISSATANLWTNIKQLRVSVRKAGGGQDSGTLKFARIAVVGNTWLRGAPGDPATGQGAIANERLIATPVNSVDNPTYTPIFNAGGEATQVFNDLYGSLGNLQKQSSTKNLSEQALQLEFTSMTIVGGVQPVVSTKRLFSRAIDISQHKFFNFLLFGNADPNNIDVSNHTFFLRVGNDTNFFEVQVPLSFTGWRKIALQQTDSNNDNIMDGWKTDVPGAVVVSSGNASLQQVAQITAGVRKTAGATETRGRIYLNEIHVSEPVVRVGTAKKFEMNYDLPGWGSFGAKHRSIDRNFQTPTSVVSNQDNRQDSGYLNFTRIQFFPLAFSLSRAITETPSTVQTGNLSNLVNLLQTGKVTTWAGSAQGNFTLGAYPRLSLSHTRNRIEYALLGRLDDRKSYNGALQYGIPLSTRFLPRTLDTSYGYSKYDISFNNIAARKLPGNFNSEELSQSLALRMTFIPWEGSGFNPNYSVTKVTERRSDFTGPVEKQLSYPKSFNQTAGFSSNYRLTRWLNPQLNYSIDSIENNILNVSTFIVQGSTYVFDIGDIKTVNRSANGALSIPITISEIFSRTKLFRSMNVVSGYQVQDGDVWNNVERGLSTAGSLWVRTPLRPANPAAQRASQTLRDTINSTQRWSPLEAYGITGRPAAFKTFSLSNNYVRSIQRTDTTGTLAKTISTTLPDIVTSMSQLEQLWYAERWMTNTQMNLRYASRRTENIGLSLATDQTFGSDIRSIVRKRFDTLITYNTRKAVTRDLRVEQNTQKTAHQDSTAQVTFDLRKFRFTPKVDYSRDVTELGTGVRTQDLTIITPSLLVRADLALPRGLMLPGAKKALLFTNRIIWTTTLSLANRSSPVTQADNSRLFSLNTSGDYEIAKNLRMTLNGAAQRLWHKFLKEEDFISYQFGTTLTFQF